MLLFIENFDSKLSMRGASIIQQNLKPTTLAALSKCRCAQFCLLVYYWNKKKFCTCFSRISRISWNFDPVCNLKWHPKMLSHLLIPTGGKGGIFFSIATMSQSCGKTCLFLPITSNLEMKSKLHHILMKVYNLLKVFGLDKPQHFNYFCLFS